MVQLRKLKTERDSCGGPSGIGGWPPTSTWINAGQTCTTTSDFVPSSEFQLATVDLQFWLLPHKPYVTHVDGMWTNFHHFELSLT